MPIVSMLSCIITAYVLNYMQIMYTSRITYRSSNEHRQGFTIVELLVVVVVIAILAAIAIVSYNGVTARATESTMRSDLQSNATAVEVDKVINGTYPTDAPSANGGKGLSVSGNNQLTYVPIGNEFCVSITNPKYNGVLRFKSLDRQVTNGLCVAMVSTLAGAGVSGFADGTGTAAKFNWPEGLAVDTGGTVYAADRFNHRIRKITPAGVVSTFAGSGTSGFADGTGTAAQFSSPTGVVVDTGGTVYIADMGNNRIRKITPAGVVSTFAGSGTSGFADGTGTAAQFYYPQGIAIDNAGTLYVADAYNHRVRKVTSSGVVTTLAGIGTAGIDDGPVASAKLTYPGSIAVDSTGAVYVTSDQGIRKIFGGVVSTPVGDRYTSGYADGTGNAALFRNARGIVIDSSDIMYVADQQNQRIRRVTPGGVVTTLAGTGNAGSVDGAATIAEFGYPQGGAVDVSGNLYFSDTNSNTIRKIAQ